MGKLCGHWIVPFQWVCDKEDKTNLLINCDYVGYDLLDWASKMFFQFKDSEDVIFINSLEIKPSFRKMGLGKVLINLCIEQIKKETPQCEGGIVCLKAAPLYSDTSTLFKRGVRKLTDYYQKMGFSKNRRGYVGKSLLCKGIL